MNTLTDVMTPHGVDIPSHLVADAEIPVLSGKAQRQGDVIVWPRTPGKTTKAADIPLEGIAVVRGEAGGNTHLLVGAGTWAPTKVCSAIIGTQTVADGDAAYLLHPEHGAHGIGAGCYTIERQQQQSDIVRLVSD
jgi:hypothetical protein